MASLAIFDPAIAFWTLLELFWEDALALSQYPLWCFHYSARQAPGHDSPTVYAIGDTICRASGRWLAFIAANISWPAGR